MPELTFESWVHDLETVVDTLGVERFDLLGSPRAVRSPSRMPCGILNG